MLAFVFFNFSSIADEKDLVNNTELSFYTGMFDFSDDGKRSSLVGFQHQNENLNRDTFLGNLSPITGALVGFSLGLDVGFSVVGETVGPILVTDGDGVIERLHVSAESNEMDSKPISKRKFGSFTGASFNIPFT